jgi:DNA-binding CsgD family transcriptional regulator
MRTDGGAVSREEFERQFDRYVADCGETVGAYSVSTVEAGQRNRAVEIPPLHDLANGLRGQRSAYWARHLGIEPTACEARARFLEWSDDRVYTPTGWGGAQLRVVLCDGDAMIGWIGVTRPAAFGQRERLLLRALIPELRTLCLRRSHFGEALAKAAAFEALAEWYAAPALLLSRAGRVTFANTAARDDLDAHSELARATLRAHLRGDPLPPNAVLVQVGNDGGQPRYLIATRPSDHTRMRVALAAQRWKLTRREAQVLARVLGGATNFAIANGLGCAEKTVETHLTRILAKAGAGNRAELAALFWRLPPG